MSIGASCEACPYLCANLPRHALTADLFAVACNEIANEHRSFHQELHDKFAYTIDLPGSSGGGMGQAVPHDERGRITGQRRGYPALPDGDNWH